MAKSRLEGFRIQPESQVLQPDQSGKEAIDSRRIEMERSGRDNCTCHEARLSVPL